MSVRLISYLVLSLALVGLACKKTPVEPDAPPDAIIPSSTKGIAASTFSTQLVSISATGDTLTFNQGATSIDDLAVDDIIVSEYGLGVLRKVTSVRRESGRITITTTQASLTEAIQRGGVSFSHTLNLGDTASVLHRNAGVEFKLHPESPQRTSLELFDVVIFDADGNLSTTHDQIRASGDIDLGSSFAISLSIDNWQLTNFTISTTFTEQMNLTVNMNLLSVEYSKKKEILRAQMHPLTFFVGWVPVVITPVLSINVGVDGRIYASISSTVSQQAEFTAGLQYANGQWSPFSNKTHTLDFQPPTITANAALKAYVAPELQFLLYGVVGPAATVSLYGKVDAELGRTPWLILYGGIDVGVGVQVRVLSHQLANFSKPDLITVNVRLWESSTLPTGKLRGTVRDAASQSPLSGAMVSVFKNTIAVASATSGGAGTYEFDVAADNGYRVVFSRQEYLNAEYSNVNIAVGQSTVLETVLQINQNYSGTGTVRGTIRNALDGTGVDAVTLRLRRGINVTSGPTIATTTSNSSGLYTFSNIDAGNYTVEATKASFNTAHFSVVCLGGQTVANQDATMAPQLTPGETRIVLTWGPTPPDLDSHFTGPLPGGGRFHMFYIYRGTSNPWPTIVNLDRDDTDGYGPETTTLYQQISGVYRFSVHDYTNRNSANSTALSNSSAQVRVYRSSGLVALFNVPPNTGGTLWTVFEMSGTTITPVNTMTYESNPGGINLQQEDKKASAL